MRLSSSPTYYSPAYKGAPKATPQFTGHIEKENDEVDSFSNFLSKERDAEKTLNRVNSISHRTRETVKRFTFPLIGKIYTPPETPKQHTIPLSSNRTIRMISDEHRFTRTVIPSESKEDPPIDIERKISKSN